MELGAGQPLALSCPVTPRELPGCSGALFCLFKNPPSLASVGQLFSISFILERLNWAVGWQRARMVNVDRKDPSPTLLPTHSRTKGNLRTRSHSKV